MNTTSTPDAPAPAQPTLAQLVFSDRQALQTSYIPLFTVGGLFIATANEHRLGDAFELLLTLPGESERRTVAGKVAWITPAHAPGGRPQGVGVAFNGSEESRAAKALIEGLLADGAAPRSTQMF